MLSLRYFAIVLSLLLLASIRIFAQPPQRMKGSSVLCYAFILDGDVWVSCQGRRERIDFKGRVWSFAVSSDGSYFTAVLPNATTEIMRATPSALRMQKSESLGAEWVTVELKGGIKSETKAWPYHVSNPELFPSCGTVIFPRPPRDSPRMTEDVRANREISFPPHGYFRCSADRRVIATWENPDNSELIQPLVIETPQEHKKDNVQAARETGQVEQFDLSPSGQYIAYFRNDVHSELCVTEPVGMPSCVSQERPPAGPDRMSVSDGPRVIFSAWETKDCFYKDELHFSEKLLSGYRDGDRCIGVDYWGPNMPAPENLESLGRAPQWITPEAAAALHEWNLLRNAKSSTIQK
jgi:hypothetical protein